MRSRTGRGKAAGPALKLKARFGCTETVVLTFFKAFPLIFAECPEGKAEPLADFARGSSLEQSSLRVSPWTACLRAASEPQYRIPEDSDW
jgi:hypothetical protein